MPPLLWIILLATTLHAEDVRVSVFGLFRPTTIEVRQQTGVIEISQQAIEDGAWHRLKPGDRVTGRGGSATVFRLRIPGKIDRTFFGTVAIVPARSHMSAIVTMPLETAVASIVAAESAPGATLEALKAQAVVARSFLAATRGRHGQYDACDTTHCQFLRAPPPRGSLAERATLDTAGIVLQYDGRVIEALYSAQCGGRTRTIAEAGWRPAAYPYVTVECKICAGKKVEGHRLGLCQRGASAMSANGAAYQAILRHYFPAASLEAMAKQ